jgi:hypothetical protein
MLLAAKKTERARKKGNKIQMKMKKFKFIASKAFLVR